MGNATAKLEVIIGGKKDGSLDKAVTQSYYSIERFASMTSSVTRTMLNAYRQGFNVAQAAISNIAETYTSFEQAMADTAAIADASVSEVERMTTAAREAGRTTTITAEDSAKALGYMALAGWSVDESIEGLLPVLRLAEATGADLKTTSDLVTDSIGAVGLSVKDLSMYMDMLVATNNNANTTAEQLMESLIKTGGAAVTLGTSIDFNDNFGLDELMTAVGVLASNGIKAEEAGTALNSILSRIGANSEAKKGLDGLGVSIYDAQGNFIGLEESLYAIGEAMEGLSDEEKMGYLKQIAGTRQFSRLAYLINSLQDGTSIAESSWGKLDAEIENSVGDLDVMNATATDTLAAAAERWQSAVNDMKIGIGTTFGDDAKDMLNEFSQRMPAIIEMVDEFGEKHSYEIKDLIDELGDFAENGAEGIFNLIEFTVDNSGTIFDLIKGLTVGQLALTGIANAAKAYKTFMLLPTPLKTLSAAVAAITAIYTGITILKNKYEKWHQEIIDDNLAEHFGNIALSIEDIEEVSKKLVYGGLQGLYEAFQEQNEELENLDKNIKKTDRDLDKADWKIKLGVEMTKDDAESYKTSVQSLISDVQSYIENARYQSSLTDKILFGEGSIIGLSDFYDGLQNEASIAGEDLAEKLDKAFADGVLTNVEAKDIEEARKRLMEIEAKIADSNFASGLAANTTDALLGGLDAQSFEELQSQNSELLDEKSETRKDAYTSKLSEINNSDMTATQKQAAIDYATQAYTAGVSSDYVSVVGAEMDAIRSQYADEITSAQNTFDTGLANVFNDISSGNAQMDSLWYYMTTNAPDSFEDSASSAAVGELTEKMSDDLQEMIALRNQIWAEGGQVDQNLIDRINQLEELQAMTGDFSNGFDYLATQILTNDEYKEALRTAAEQGEAIPINLVDAMAEQCGLSEDEIETLINDFANNIDMLLNRDLGTYTPTINIVPYLNIQNAPGHYLDLPDLYLPSTYDWKDYYIPDDVLQSWADEWQAGGTIQNNALGGIYDNEILTRVAEDGSSEAIIPINNAARSRNLWYETGARMGLIGGGRDTALLNGLGQTTNNSSNMAIQFSPTVYASGNASSDEIKTSLRMSMQEFKSMMDDYMRENARTAFGV